MLVFGWLTGMALALVAGMWIGRKQERARAMREQWTHAPDALKQQDRLRR